MPELWACAQRGSSFFFFLPLASFKTLQIYKFTKSWPSTGAWRTPGLHNYFSAHLSYFFKCTRKKILKFFHVRNKKETYDLRIIKIATTLSDEIMEFVYWSKEKTQREVLQCGKKTYDLLEVINERRSPCALCLCTFIKMMFFDI